MPKDKPKLELVYRERKRIEGEVAALAQTAPDWPSCHLDVGCVATAYEGEPAVPVVWLLDSARGVSIKMSVADAKALARFLTEWLEDE